MSNSAQNPESDGQALEDKLRTLVESCSFLSFESEPYVIRFSNARSWYELWIGLGFSVAAIGVVSTVVGLGASAPNRSSQHLWRNTHSASPPGLGTYLGLMILVTLLGVGIVAVAVKLRNAFERHHLIDFSQSRLLSVSTRFRVERRRPTCLLEKITLVALWPSTPNPGSKLWRYSLVLVDDSGKIHSLSRRGDTFLARVRENGALLADILQVNFEEGQRKSLPKLSNGKIEYVPNRSD